MESKSTIAQFAQATLLIALTANLAACQKAKMSSTPKPVQQPAVVNPVRPGVPLPPPGVVNPPGVVPRPGIPVLPGTVVTPTQPPIVVPGPSVTPGGPGIPTTPGTSTVVIPPRTSPPTLPPSTPPVVDTPTVTPVVTPTTPTTPVTPGVPVSPTTPTTPATPPPTVVATPPGGSQTVIVPTIVPNGVVVGAPINTVGGPVYMGNSSVIAAARPAGIGVTPTFVGPLHVIRPMSVDSKILKTCVGKDCGNEGQVFTGSCQDSKCSVETIVVERREQILCPEIQLRERQQTNKLDILFVVDTSASMIEERTEIARQMTSFINALNPEVDYRIAVLLGHGPESKKSRVGELFVPADIDTTYGVIYKDALEVAVAQNMARYGQDASSAMKKHQETAAYVSKRLAEMMAKVPNDDSKVQGEAGLLNLYTAVTTKLSLMQSRDFWRKDAAKTVVFVADENDVCFDYKSYNEKAHGANRANYEMARAKNVDKNDLFKRDPVEIASYNDFNVCQGTAQGQQLTPQKVYDAVVASSDFPVAFTGILYTSNSRIPKKTDRYLLDNEMGRGYLDVIALGKGLAAELADKDFGRQLAKFGDFANFIRKYDFAFEMRGVVDFNDIDPVTVNVYINDGKGGEHNFNGSYVFLDRDATTGKIFVVIRYEALKTAYEDGKIDTQKAKIKIYYSTKSGRRPVETTSKAVPAQAQSKVDPYEDAGAQGPAQEIVVPQATQAPAAAASAPADQASSTANSSRKGTIVYYNFLGLKIPGYIMSAEEREEERRNRELYGN